jgi:hypothetical protein
VRTLLVSETHKTHLGAMLMVAIFANLTYNMQTDPQQPTNHEKLCDTENKIITIIRPHLNQKIRQTHIICEYSSNGKESGLQGYQAVAI